MEITLNLTVSEILEIAPDSVVILKNAGLPVGGCNFRTDIKMIELVEQKNLSQDETDKLLINLNKLKQQDISGITPQKSDFLLKEISEGNKQYFALAGMLFTQSAYNNLHQIATAKGLRIHLTTGGCSGFKYEFDFYDQPAPDEKTFQLSEKLNIYMNDFTFSKSHGSIVEFKLGLHESGLQILNPNKKRSCSCGTSIAF